jgi:hypothetical protein
MPATQLWLQFIHGTVYGQQMVHIKPPHNPTGMLIHKLHCSTKAFTVAQKKLMSSICRQDMKACFISAFLANWLSARCLFMGPNRWNSLGMKLVLQGPPNHTTTTSHKSRWQWMRNLWGSLMINMLTLFGNPASHRQCCAYWPVKHPALQYPAASFVCSVWYRHDTSFTLDVLSGHSHC